MVLRRLKNGHPAWSLRANDAGLTALFAAQCLMTFCFVPLVATHVVDRWLMDAGLLVTAVVCAIAFTQRRATQVILVSSLLAIVLGPPVWTRLTAGITESVLTPHETISFAAFVFNLIVTILVARHVFGAGRVTGHRILGAVLVYLNVAVLFSIMYDILDSYVGGGAIRAATGNLSIDGSGNRIAELSYFSLTTITTCGYGDLAPTHPLARSLANLEAIFGQLFPAIFVARLVALQLTHSRNGKK
jgi:hypothetical protein